MYISRNTAVVHGEQAVREGKARAYRVFFTRERDADTHEIIVGYKLYLFN